jgi:serine protease inhibitor
MKKLTLLFVIPLLMLSCSNDENGAKGNDQPTVINTTSDEKDMVKKGNDFANKMLYDLCNQNEGNVTLSPISMEYLLAMIANGANETSLNEIQTAMDFSNFSLQDMNGYYSKLCTALTNADKQVTISLANGMWIQKDFPVNSSYVSSMEKIYDASVKNVNFSDIESTTNIINEWCSDHTNGLIKKLSLNMNKNMKMVLANATYFKGSWTNKFNEKLTSRGVFTDETNNQSNVNMMCAERSIDYCKLENCQAISLPYGNKTFSMILILPNEGVKVNSLISGMEWDELNFTKQEVLLYLPKFKVENHWGEFANTLKALGIKQIFAEGSQLDKISKNLFVSAVSQDVYLEVNEEGTEAAAVSAAGMNYAASTGNDIPLHFNRPFFYAIRENSTGTILFMGKISKL